MASKNSRKAVNRAGASVAVVRSVTPPASPAPSESREELIARTAYFRAEQRGFEPGREIEDWLAAEAEVDEKLRTPRAQG